MTCSCSCKLLCPALLAAALLAVSPRQVQAISGGEFDGDRHPNVGTFVVPHGIDYDLDGLPDWDGNEDGLPDVPAIGGNLTLIHPRIAVGAAHVFQIAIDEIAAGYTTLDDQYVSFSSEPALHPETWHQVSDIIIHPDYEPHLLPGWGALPRVDVGVLVLKDPVEDITPATLAPAGFLDDLDAAGLLRQKSEGAPFTVVGYGTLGEPPNQILPIDQRRHMAVSEYMHHLDRWLFLDQNARHGNGGSLDFDSGGATFWVDPATGEETLVAIVSNGDATGVALGINFRTDTAEVLDFIASVIARVEAGEFDANGLAQHVAVGAVPEPSAALLACFGAAAAVLYRGKRRRP